MQEERHNISSITFSVILFLSLSKTNSETMTWLHTVYVIVNLMTHHSVLRENEEKIYMYLSIDISGYNVDKKTVKLIPKLIR